MRVLFVAMALGALCPCAYPQEAVRRETPAEELKGVPPRSAPTDYQAHAQAGPLTIAAEFAGHSAPTADGAYETEDFVVVETAVFGPPDARATLSTGDFSLRINGKKPSPSEPYERVRGSLKDPNWGPPKPESKPKTSFGGASEDTPAPVHMPMDLRVAMEQRVRSAVMLQGERTLPQAGLLFFEYRGKTKNIHSLELIYSGPSGKAVLDLQP